MDEVKEDGNDNARNFRMEMRVKGLALRPWLYE